MAEVARLRHKLSPKEDKEFTKLVVRRMDINHTGRLKHFGLVKNGAIVMTPAQVWDNIMGRAPGSYSVKDTTKLCRSLQALGWERGAHNGNLIFSITVEEYDNACKMG